MDCRVVRGKLKYEGISFKNIQGLYFIVVKYHNSKNVDIEFSNGYKICKVLLKHILNGSIKNHTHPSVFNVGYIGVGNYTVNGNGLSKSVCYNSWQGMLRRCYSLDNKSYKWCKVDKQWHNFQNFAKWFHENYNTKTMEGWHLDKDILVKGNKIYSPETCCFVPPEINSLFTKSTKSRGQYPIGVTISCNRFIARVNTNNRTNNLGTYNTPEEAFQAYRIAKEAYIKEVADKWKDLISERVYESMYNYKVEESD